jgi:hypothetical protein
MTNSVITARPAECIVQSASLTKPDSDPHSNNGLRREKFNDRVKIRSCQENSSQQRIMQKVPFVF